MGAVTGDSVLFFLAVMGTLAGLWWRIESRIDRTAKAVADDANTKAQAAHATAALVQGQLAEFKLEAARTYVSKDDVQQVRDDILGAVGGVHKSLDRINERLDRVVENAAKRQPVHRS